MRLDLIVQYTSHELARLGHTVDLIHLALAKVGGCPTLDVAEKQKASY